jgi:hypothetical protein
MEDRSNTVTSNIRKNNAVIRYRWSQHGRQIKHSTLQYQKNNAVIRYRWWSQHGRQIKHSTLQYQKKLFFWYWRVLCLISLPCCDHHLWNSARFNSTSVLVWVYRHIVQLLLLI